MKQVAKTPDVIAKFTRSVGMGVDVNSVAIYEVIALNTLPLRKGHPLYNGAKADRSLLLEMAAALAHESRPLQAQHNSEPLPLGRVFHGEVIERNGESELRALMFVSGTEAETIAKLDNGTIDQVSVSILPKQIVSSATGFDFLSAAATFENRFLGVDDKGNKLGEKGVYAKLIGLDKWFELSLVGQGGANDARIVHRDESHFGSSYEKLAASGVDPSAFVLTATSTGIQEMDFTALIADLSTKSTDIAQKQVKIEGLEAANTSLTAQVAELNTKLTQASDAVASLAAKDAELSAANEAKTAAETASTEAVAALQEVAKKVLAAAGKQSTEVPATVAELNTLIEENATALVAALGGGKGNAAGADSSGASPVKPTFNNAFRRPR